MQVNPSGALLFSEHLTRQEQDTLVREVKRVLATAPLYHPFMPRSGKPLSVRMTNCGAVGWVSDINGYRYQAEHPETGKPWPDIPNTLIELWQAVTPEATPLPDACLVNFYDASAKMGLHQDRDEADLTHPVVSISLGDEALFRLGGKTRKDKTKSFRLRSGDVLVLQGEDRLAYHGIDRIFLGSSSLLTKGGRINITLRKAL